MKDAAGKVQYVGKAISPYNRDALYFQNRPISARGWCGERIKRCRLGDSQNELRPWCLSNFIKQNRPKYNVLLRDDRIIPILRSLSGFPQVVVCAVFSAMAAATSAILLWLGRCDGDL